MKFWHWKITTLVSHDWYFAEMKKRKHTDIILRAMNEGLNDDCILMIMQFLDSIDLLYMANFNQRFRVLASRRSKFEVHPSVIMRRIGLMTLRYALTTLRDAVANLIISMDSIQPDNFFNFHSFFLSSALAHCIQKYSGPKLKVVSLEKFEREETRTLVSYLLTKFQCRGVQMILPDIAVKSMFFTFDDFHFHE